MRHFTQSNKQISEDSSIQIKILTNYAQIVSCVASFDLDLPKGLFELPDTVGRPI